MKTRSQNRRDPERATDMILLAIALASLGLFLPALGIRDPIFTRVRTFLYFAIPAYCVVTTTLLLYLLRRDRETRDRTRAANRRRLISIWLLIATVSIGLFALSREQSYAAARRAVLRAAGDPAVMLLGEHFVVGYRDPGFVYELIEHDALGGVFITHHNVRGRSLVQIRDEIAGFQTARARRGRPPLWITTDQEGGSVSRLSPPLPGQPFLSALLADDRDTKQPGDLHRNRELAERLRAYGDVQGRALADLGINVNFSPVVDLRVAANQKSDPAMGWMDAFSRIETRAIHRDPKVVAYAAGHYARGLMDQDITPTLKHFPGLGRLAADTHWFSAAVPVAPEVLEQNDWEPFRYLGTVLPRETPDSSIVPWIMLGHAHVPAVDAKYAASHSRKIVHGILREKWAYEGVLITDDYNMRPILLSEGGLGGAATRALNAGVDLLLISYDGDNVYPTLNALLQAWRNGDIDAETLARSKTRLRRARRVP